MRCCPSNFSMLKLVATSCTCPPFMICSTVTSLLKGRSGSSLGVRRKHCGVPSLRRKIE
jgi:hypothetical protein